MVVGEVAERADFLVIGGGPGGYSAALAAAQLGRKVTLVQDGGSRKLGGTCLHVGCIPSKALIEVASKRHSVLAGSPMGLRTEGISFDMATFRNWEANLIETLADGVARLMQSNGVTVLDGIARFSSPRRVAIEEPLDRVRFVEFNDAIIATGSAPASVTDIPFDGGVVLSSTELLALDELPRSLAVVGAGYIGIELGTAMAKLGVAVTLIEVGPRILPGCPGLMVRPVQARLSGLGVSVIVGATARRHEKGLIVRSATGETVISVERILVATGRKPLTADLGLDYTSVGLLPSGHVRVDQSMRAADHISAIGDVVLGPALAHRASSQAAVAARVLSGIATTFDAVVPMVVFSDPEIALVGLTEEEAVSAGMAAGSATVPLTTSGRAATIGQTEGIVQIVVDREQDTIVGIHIASPHASELAGEAAVAIELGASPLDLAMIVHPHPTISESISEVSRVFLRRRKRQSAEPGAGAHQPA